VLCVEGFSLCFPCVGPGKVWSDPTKNLSSKVTVVSVSGGERDVMVPSHLSAVPSATLAVGVSEGKGKGGERREREGRKVG